MVNCGEIYREMEAWKRNIPWTFQVALAIFLTTSLMERKKQSLALVVKADFPLTVLAWLLDFNTGAG